LIAPAVTNGKPFVALVLSQLAYINWFLMVFNLLPAFPLDGGHTLDAIHGKLAGPLWGKRIVGGLTIVVSVLIALYAITGLPNSIFLMFLAFWMAEMNWAQLQSAGGFRR
jgi:Zn-dependent protease